VTYGLKMSFDIKKIRSISMKERIYKFGLTKIKVFYEIKSTKKMKRQVRLGENVCETHT
jgi:hypothetical protein